MQIGRADAFKRKDILLPHSPDGTSVTPLNFTFTYPEASAASLGTASRPKLPLVLLLNGASVESFWYRRVIGDLASKGFVVASTDYYRPIPSGSPFKPSEQCMPPAGYLCITGPTLWLLCTKLLQSACSVTVYCWTRAETVLVPAVIIKMD